MNSQNQYSHLHATASRTFAKPTWGKGMLIKVTARIDNPGNATPHFSVTAEIYKPGRPDCEACGCLHEDALKAWPKVKPLIDLHLSCAVTGEPMHAEANGFYWLAGHAADLYHFGEKYSGKEGANGRPALQVFAEHCRIDELETAEILCQVRAAFLAGVGSVHTGGVSAISEVSPRCQEEMLKEGRRFAREAWKTICDGMRPRWQKEAEAGRALLASLVRTEPVPA